MSDYFADLVAISFLDYYARWVGSYKETDVIPFLFPRLHLLQLILAPR